MFTNFSSFTLLANLLSLSLLFSFSLLLFYLRGHSAWHVCGFLVHFYCVNRCFFFLYDFEFGFVNDIYYVARNSILGKSVFFK